MLKVQAELLKEFKEGKIEAWDAYKVIEEHEDFLADEASDEDVPKPPNPKSGGAAAP